ncbi:MAG TPA: hypothetical protein VGU61_20310 [Noviherbaspirillum sp.]|jgi:hypothetical protein|uniref:hypothetical protein n=1 Tax=Noviherbaspirillum sp. TaxID=1926288 RepID=UPI002DDD9F6C|nr:hypothetical protein [Noviherbaspirillum sp.]HEV2612618.1 hypothetical protein [Noviherbaspirillum sp.]
MKAIFLALLLFVFAAQGCVVAVGANLMEAGNPASTEAQPGKPAQVVDGAAKQGILDLAATDVLPSIEEMSDYVSIQVADNGGKESVIPPVAVILTYASIVLPKFFPPPRA